jgi:hypothetical protein
LELTWVLKIRLAAAAVLGIVIIGILAFPLVEPADPYSVISLTAGQFTIEAVLILAALALVCGVLGFFVSWPHGKEIGIFAVPFGLSVWAIRTGSVANLIQSNPAVGQRHQIFAALKWEPLFWLAIVFLGFAGVYICQLIFKPENKLLPVTVKKEQKLNVYLRIVIALSLSVLLGKVCIDIFAQDVTFLIRHLGHFTGQPAIGQIVFGVFVSFLIVGFVVKKFLDLSYFWPIIATAFVTLFAVITSLSKTSLENLAENFPANFFPNVALAVLPIQLVAFGTIGAIAGYWSALRYQYWREHELE